jgi:hypothetical protein
MPNLLENVFPEYEWLPWKFKHYSVVKGFWDSIENQKKFLNYVSKELKYNKKEDWYKISAKVDFNCFLSNVSQEIQELGGVGILGNYKNSPLLLISTVYPEYDWLPWKFNVTPHGFWSDKKNQRNFMDWAAKELNYKNKEDWYNISVKVSLL